MPTLYILCGASQQARAALARQLVAARDIAYVSLEQVKADEGYFMHDADVPDADWSGIEDVVHASLLMPLRLGRDVIYDAPNLTRRERDDLRHLASRRGFASKLIYVPSAEEGANAPTDDEGAIVYQPGQDVTRWVKANL